MGMSRKHTQPFLFLGSATSRNMPQQLSGEVTESLLGQEYSHRNGWPKYKGDVFLQSWVVLESNGVGFGAPVIACACAMA